jgi:hypothetical protein
MLNLAMKLLANEHRYKYLHEWCHMLQMLFFPYQYQQTWKELTIVRQLRRQLATHAGEMPIGKLDLPEYLVETITNSSMVHPLRRTPLGGIGFDEEDPDPLHPSPYDLTALDLIEDFASLFEYKCRIAAEGNGEDYATWVSNPDNKVYATVFWFLADLWNTQFAYRLAPALIQASFYTDWVFNSFCSLLSWLLSLPSETYEAMSTEDLFFLLKNRLLKWGSPHPRKGRFEPLIRDVTEFDYSPHLVFAEAKPYYQYDFTQSPPQLVGTIDSPGHPTLLTQQFMAKFASKTERHPLYLYAAKYLDILTAEPKIETALFHPYEPSVMDFLTEEFPPVLMVVRLVSPQLVGRDTLIKLGTGFDNSDWPAMPGVSYREYLTDLMKRKDIAWSLVTTINDALPHNCHHQLCPFFDTNLCRRWTAIPARYWHCAFPNWLSTVYELKINLKSRTLVPQGEEVGMNAKKSLHIEGSQEALEEFRKFIFDESPELARAIRPINMQSPGIQREPIVISLVVALGGPVIVKELCSLAKRYLDLVSEREKQVHQTKTLKLLLEQEDRSKREVTFEQLLELYK